MLDRISAPITHLEPNYAMADLGKISLMSPLPEGYHYAFMSRGDIAPLILSIREWFPSVTVGLGSWYLAEQFYLDDVVMEDDMDKSVLVLLIKKGIELVGFGSWERESAALTLFARLGAIAPAHRGARMAVTAMELGEKMGGNGRGLYLHIGNDEDAADATRARARGVQTDWLHAGL